MSDEDIVLRCSKCPATLLLGDGGADPAWVVAWEWSIDDVFCPSCKSWKYQIECGSPLLPRKCNRRQLCDLCGDCFRCCRCYDEPLFATDLSEEDEMTFQDLTRANQEIRFSELSEANRQRCEEVFHPIDEWSPTDWACAMGGECGETVSNRYC